VVFSSAQSQETVTLEGTDYSLHVTGFRQDGNVVSKFISPEDGSNSADIVAKLVAVPAVAKPPVKPPVLPEEKCRIKTVIDTSTLLVAALERLNRHSVVYLLEQVMAELNEHCEKLGGIVTSTGGESGDLNALRIELLGRLNEIHQKSEWYVTEINNLKQQITSLQINLPQTIQQTVQTINIDEVMKQINVLNDKLVIIQKAAQELDESELRQVELLLEKLLQKIDLSRVTQTISISIDKHNYDLRHLIEILATADQILGIHIHYSDPDLWDIAGARFILTDQTQVIFNLRIVLDDIDGHRVTYFFETGDWKGIPAQFSLVFRARRNSYKLCANTVDFDFFDLVEQTNIVFDLCPQITALTTAQASA
jgi:hypothetical protein